MELISILKDFLKQEKTDYSLLISGEWGSGKTFFLKNSLFPTIRETKVNIAKNNKNVSLSCDPLYISLFGISEICEIDKRLFLELNPKLKTKPAYALSFIANKLSGIVNLKWFDKDDYSDYLSVFSIPSNKVLCFDDIERINESLLNEALGYINSFVEHQNVKVIIIGDEQILRQKVKEYDKIKEKIIRFTYSFEPNITKVFDSFVSIYPVNYKDFLIGNKRFICEIFNRGNHKNLRTLRFHFDLFEKIFSNAETYLEDNKYRLSVLDRFLFFATTYAIEYKKINNKDDLNDLKHLNSQNLLNIANIDFNSINQNNDPIEISPQDKSYNEKFRETYLPFDNHLFDYYEFIANYIHTGYLSLEDLKQNISSICDEMRLKEATEEDIIINKLANIFKLNDEEFTPLLNDVFEKVEKGAFELATYPNIFASLLQIEHYKINNFQIDETIFKRFEKGIDISKTRSKYLESFRYRIPIWQGTNNKYKRISDYAIQANESLQAENIRNYAQNIPNLIETNKGEELYQHLSNKDLLFIPLYIHLDPVDIFNKLAKSNNSTIYYFRDSLYCRYRSEIANECTKKETYFFANLLDLINNHITQNKTITISIVALTELQKEVNRIVTLREI